LEKKTILIVDDELKIRILLRDLDLLELSQMESGFFSVNKTYFNISSLISSIIFKYKPVFEEKNICIDVEFKEELMGNADIVRIDQIIVNLINNAIEHIDDKKIIRLSEKVKDNKIRVAVFNSGQPIPEESLDKIWSSFYKVDKARTRIIGGTGLGLSIVRAIQIAHKNAYGVKNIKAEIWSI